MKITQPIVIDELRMVLKTWTNSQAGMPGERVLPMADSSVKAISFPSLHSCGEGQEREESTLI